MNQKDPITSVFRLSASGETTKGRRHETEIVVGRDFTVATQALENFCFQRISDRDYELIIIAGAVGFIDRSVCRKHSTGWQRTFKIFIPVTDPGFWNQEVVKFALVDVLEYLTGDSWDFEFVQRKKSWNELNQQELPLGGGKFVVVPFSSGLDSFAQSQLLKLQRPNEIPIRLTTWNGNVTGFRNWIYDSDGTRYRRVSIPLKLSTGPHSESSYRTRSFIFATFAAIASHLAEAESIVIPEAGQGALGPSIVPFGAESFHRGSHPTFTGKMAKLCRVLWNRSINFEHPQLWLTKGEVLGILKHENLLGKWEETSSCPRDQRNVSLGGFRVHCGVCAACLLRRVAVYAAGICESPDKYLWRDLTAATLDGAMRNDSTRVTSANDRDIGVHGVLDMNELAKKAAAPVDDPAIAQLAFELNGHVKGTSSEILSNIQTLLIKHKTEWDNFRRSFGAGAWINKISDS